MNNKEKIDFIMYVTKQKYKKLTEKGIRITLPMFLDLIYEYILDSNKNFISIISEIIDIDKKTIDLFVEYKTKIKIDIKSLTNLINDL